MLALMLSAIIFSGIMTIVLALQKNMLLQNAWVSIQDNSRTSMQILQSAIRIAGYRGCSTFPVESLAPYHPVLKKPNTNGITIKAIDPDNSTLIRDIYDNHTLYLSGTNTFKNTDSLVITNCKTTETFKIRSQSKKSDGSIALLTEAPLHHRYKIYSEVSRLLIDSYYIAKTTRKDKKGNFIYALYHEDIHARKLEIVEGVEDMKISYGVLENNHLTEYPSEKITREHQIVSVTFELLFSSFPLTKRGFMTVALRN
jgi:hypothetical protein